MSVFLHAAFGLGQLWLWGETAAGKAIPLPKHRRRKSDPLWPPPNPFDAGAEVLDDAAKALGLPPTSFDRARAVLWLPTVKGRPIASTAVVEEPPESLAGAEIAAWETTALAVNAMAFADLLTRRTDDEVLAPGLFASSDLKFWQAVLRLAGSLVARQCVLPGLKEDDGRLTARWEPVLLAGDAQAVARLARAMPDAARAASAPWRRRPMTSLRPSSGTPSACWWTA